MFERFRPILRYLAVPLQTAPLLLIIVFSALMTLAIKASLLGISLGLLLLTGFFRYSFLLLDQLVEGRTDPPVLSIEMMNPVGEQRALMMLAFVIAIFFGSGAAVYWFGPLLSIVIGILTMCGLLAILAVQGATGSLAQSLNPVRCVRLMLRLGKDYAFLVACALALWLLTGAAGALGAPLVVRIAMFLFGWLAVFSLIGGILYERRQEIGLDDAYEPEMIELDDSADIERSRERNIDRIYAEWRGGAHKNAWQSVMSSVSQSADPLVELRWIYARARGWPDQRLGNRLAQEILPRLLAQRQNGEALDMLRDRLSVSAEFRPAASTDLIRLAQLARDAGDRRVARELLREFPRFYPNDPGEAAASLLMQQLER